jgi:hypothetical protein
MLITERDEMLIQRCIDGELSVAETRVLLKRLDSLPEGWKTLACCLLEDRNFGKVLCSPGTQFRNTAHQSETNTSQPAAIPASRARELAKHWWSHPVTSLTLCAAIAFVGGMLISGDSVFRSPAQVVKTSQNPVKSSASLQNPSSSYLVQMHPGESPVEIPVVSNLKDLSDLRRDHPLFSQSGQTARKVRWVMVRVDDERTLLVPVFEDADLELQ